MTVSADHSISGWLADVYFGRFKVVFFGVFVAGLAHIILVVGALPSVLQRGAGMAPFIIGLLILALGAGKWIFRTYKRFLLISRFSQGSSKATSPLSFSIKILSKA